MTGNDKFKIPRHMVGDFFVDGAFDRLRHHDNGIVENFSVKIHNILSFC